MNDGVHITFNDNIVCNITNNCFDIGQCDMVVNNIIDCVIAKLDDNIVCNDYKNVLH